MRCSQIWGRAKYASKKFLIFKNILVKFLQITNIVETACKEGGFEPIYLNVNQQCAFDM